MHRMRRELPPLERTRAGDFSTVRRIVRSFAPYRWRVALILVLTLLQTLVGLLNPLLTQRLFDDAIGGRDQRLLLLIIGAMAATPLVSAVINIGETWLNTVVGQRVMQDLRNELYDHLQRMPLQFFTSTRTGEIQSRLSNDVAGIENVLSNTFVNAVRNVATALSTVAAMVILSPTLTLLSLVFVPFVYLFGTRVGQISRSLNAARQARMASMTAMLEETLSVSGALLVKLFGQGDRVRREFAAENESLAKLTVRRQMVGVGLMSTSMTLFALAPVMVYLIAGWQIINSPEPPLTVGTIIAFTAVQARLIGGRGPITDLLNIRVQLQGSLALFDRIYDYLDLPITIADPPNPVSLDPGSLRGEVTFDNVDFSYGGETGSPRVLDGVSFTARPGQVIALVGPSGAGKSTLISLVSRLYDVTSGSVRVDGHDVRALSLATLSDVMAVVTQETYLFHASVADNLRFAKPDASDDELIDAARSAAIHDRIVALSSGYATVVGERGYKLSGGEKQRIAIARAMLKDPRILILDEATSALDSTSERLVQDALARLMPGRTTLAIAHRLSTILAADLILVLDDGRIVERGTHNDLVAADGLYAQLYRQQLAENADQPVDDVSMPAAP